jgi:hypothetical protein
LFQIDPPGLQAGRFLVACSPGSALPPVAVVLASVNQSA